MVTGNKFQIFTILTVTTLIASRADENFFSTDDSTFFISTKKMNWDAAKQVSNVSSKLIS